MKRYVGIAVVAAALTACTTEMQKEAQQDRQSFLQCKQVNPTNWGDKCNSELQMYYTTSASAQADSAQRGQTANAIASGFLAGATAVVAAANEAQANRVVVVQPVIVQPVVVCGRWRCY